MTFFTKTIKTFLMLLVSVQFLNAQIYVQDFESGQPTEWTYGPHWIYGNASEIATVQYFEVGEHTNFMAINDDGLGQDVNGYTSLAYSESIDLTNEMGDLFLGFSVYFPDGDYGGDETAKVYISNDAGDTWTEIYEVEKDEFDWQNIILDINDYGGQLIHVGFEYDDGGVWNTGFAFDDVIIDNENPGLAVDLRANQNWFSIPSNVISPANQNIVFYPMSDFENVGIEDQTGVVISVDIEDASGNNLHSDEIDFGTLLVDSLAENQFFEEFTPTEVGLYRGSYSITGDNVDLDPNNNENVFNFFISDSTFANEFYIEDALEEQNVEVNYSSFWINPNSFFADNPDVVRQYGAGNVFKTGPGDGTDQYVRYITVGIRAVEPGAVDQPITFSLYKWNDDNADDIANAGEYIPVGVSGINVQGGEEAIYTLPFEDILTGGQPVLIEPNSTYILMFEYLNSTNDPNSDVSCYLTQFSDLYFLGTNFAYAENGELDMNSILIWAEDNTGISGKDYIPLSGNGLTYSPLLRMSIGEPLSSNIVELSRNNSTSIFPLPAADFVNLQMSFEEVMNEVAVTVMDDAGKVITTMELNDIKDHTIEYNTSNLASGVYFFNIATAQGSRAEMFIVQH